MFHDSSSAFLRTWLLGYRDEIERLSIPLHEEERSIAGLESQNRKGAKPDLSQKSVTLTEPINVPLACKA